MKTRTKILIAVSVVVGLAVVGTVTGVVVSEKNKNNNQPSTQGNPSSTSSRISATTTSNSNPSPTDIPDIEVNPALHKSFWGIAYTPFGAIPPACGATLANVTQDIGILSQLTTRLRLYGSDCNATALVLQAIQDTQVDMSIFAGIFLEDTDESYVRQKTVLQDTLAAYGTDRVLGAAVGNEFVLVNIQDGLPQEAATTRVVEKITEVRTDFEALGFNIPIGTSDAGGTIFQPLVDASDFVFANIHPWFSANTVEAATTFANDFYESTMIPMGAASPRNTVMYQGEMGWPTATDEGGVATNQVGSPASDASLQILLDSWVCSSNTAGTPYFWFSAFDEAWKAEAGPIEAHWGLFDVNYQLKAITIPDCIAP